MKVFIGTLGVLLLAVLLWLWVGQSPDSAEEPPPADQPAPGFIQVPVEPVSDPETGSQPPLNGNTADQTVSVRFSGNNNHSATAPATNTGNGEQDTVPLSVAETYYATNDLAALYQQLQTPSGPEDYYYRYRILAECNDLRVRGIDAQLDTCERIAEHSARGSADSQVGMDESMASGEIAEACFDFTERCSNLDFDNIETTPAQALQEAVEQGSVLANAANLYQLSADDPQIAREWLAAALNEQPSGELLRHSASFLRSALRLRNEPFLGASDSNSVLLAERALDLTACRLDTGCSPGGHFMLSRCSYLPGCLPWQSYEQWLFQTYNSSPDDLNAILQLSQDYQQLLLNGQAELLVFPDLIDDLEGGG